jgi:putative DNA primase/helicase
VNEFSALIKNIFEKDNSMIIDSNNDNRPLQFATLYLTAGYSPIPVKARSKLPVHSAWQELQLRADELSTNFEPNHNVSIVLGDLSSGLIDIDIDDINALQLAQHFLPHTDFVFGRKSKPASHYVYTSGLPGSTKQWKAGKIIVELRATGSQTVFPGSIHESGEPIEFDQATGSGLPHPANIDRKALESALDKIAIGTVLSWNWAEKSRHEVALATAGLLAQSDWTEVEVTDLICAIASVAGDPEIQDRARCVRTTFERVETGIPVKARSALVDVIGRDAVRHIEKFLRTDSDSHFKERRAPNSSLQCTRENISTDHDAAVAFAKSCAGNVLYATDSQRWLHRKAQVFEPIDRSMMQRLAGDFATTLEEQLGADARRLKSRSKINAIVELSRSQLAIDDKLIDAKPHLVGLADGRILDLATGTFVPAASQDVFVTKRLGTAYDPNARCLRWNEFLKAIFEGNRNVIDFIQRAVGYCLSGDVSEQCLFILIGTGANGKSTLINALHNMFGDYAGSTPMHTLTVMPFSNGQSNDLASIEGRRFVSASDGEAGQALAESKIKHMTGGDKISCRPLYKDYRSYEPQFKLWIATNDLPNVKGFDPAIWRRIRVIEFPVTISEEQRDPRLAEQLAAEAPGILNWALQGYRDWKRGGLNAPPEISEATNSYRRDNDLVGQFIDARCEVREGAHATTKSLYVAYCQWCEENGCQAMALNAFGKEMKRKGFGQKKGQKGNSLVGVELKPDLSCRSKPSVGSRRTTTTATGEHDGTASNGTRRRVLNN